MLQRRRRQLVRLASGHSRTPRTGAQDEAHRLKSDFELSLGAQGGAVCFSNLEAPVSLLLLHLSFRYNEEPCVPATLQQVCDIHTRPSYQPLTHGRKGPTGLNAPCSLQTQESGREVLSTELTQCFLMSKKRSGAFGTCVGLALMCYSDEARKVWCLLFWRSLWPNRSLCAHLRGSLGTTQLRSGNERS